MQYIGSNTHLIQGYIFPISILCLTFFSCFFFLFPVVHIDMDFCFLVHYWKRWVFLNQLFEIYVRKGPMPHFSVAGIFSLPRVCEEWWLAAVVLSHKSNFLFSPNAIQTVHFQPFSMTSHLALLPLIFKIESGGPSLCILLQWGAAVSHLAVLPLSFAGSLRSAIFTPSLPTLIN